MLRRILLKNKVYNEIDFLKNFLIPILSGSHPEEYLNQNLGNASIGDLFSIFKQDLRPDLNWTVYWLIISFTIR